MQLFRKNKSDNVDVFDEQYDKNIETDTLEERDMFNNGESNDNDLKSIDQLVDETIEYFTQIDPIKLNLLERGKLNRDIFEADVHEYLSKITSDQDRHNKIFKGFASFIWSYDIIDELIEDDTISDIKIYNENNIRIKRLGKRESANIKFRNKEHFIKFVEHVAIKNKVSISDQNAAQNFTDKKSSDDAILRFNITTGFINSSEEPVLHIRKIPKQKYTLEQLIEFGMFDKETAEYLIDKAANGEGILFTGKGASGKTTLMNFLLDYIPEEYSGLVIQENEELFSNHPDMAFEHTVVNRGEGKIEYTLQDLARNGLLTDLDYFIIGEIKGGEALYLLNAVYTGHRGWASVHGASSTEAMNKLVDYIKYNSDYTQEEALQMLVHMPVVVFLERFKVKEISEITGFNEKTGKLEYKKVL